MLATAHCYYFFSLFFLGFAIPMKYSGISGDGREVLKSPPLKLPMNNLCSNAGEGRAKGLMRFKFFTDTENIFNHPIWCFRIVEWRCLCWLTQVLCSNSRLVRL